MKENGITEEELIKEQDIVDDNGFTGYHKIVSIKDYVLVINDNTKQANMVKEIIVEISYKLASEDKNIKISTYITKE